MGDTRIDEENGFKKYKTTAKHFKIFKEECNRLIREFGLLSFAATYAHVEDDTNTAKVIYTADYRTTITLATIVEDYEPPTDEYIRRLARHEIAHLLIGKIHIMATQRNLDKNALEEELEAYAHRMEEFLSNVKKKKGGK